MYRLKNFQINFKPKAVVYLMRIDRISVMSKMNVLALIRKGTEDYFNVTLHTCRMLRTIITLATIARDGALLYLASCYRVISGNLGISD